MASDVEICNRALQLLGATRIVALTDDSVSARACNNAYDAVRRAELRAHPWGFAIKRAQLPADGTAPAFGPARAFPLPSDFLRLMPQDAEDNLNDKDWAIEKHNGSKCILTDDSAPLNIRYIYDCDDPNEMDALFREAFAYSLALAMCEELTQSNTKKAELREDRKAVIREARRTNGIERVPMEAAEDTWLTARA